MIDSDPIAILREIADGFSVSRCLHVVAELGIADALDETPQTAEALAASADVHAGALRRVMRLLCAHGVFAMQGDRYCHSPSSRRLRTDHPRSMRPYMRLVGSTFNWASYQALEYSVRTGLPAAGEIHPGGFWPYMAAHPHESSVFNAAMTARGRAQATATIAAYDFSELERIGDIGGGRGHLLRAVLDATPAARGVLFDLPRVLNEAADAASDRLTLQPGDFFKDSLPCCDAYLLMDVLLNWPDDDALGILEAVRRAAPPHARLLVIEMLVTDDPRPHWSKRLDIHMLASLGGRQRTLSEFETMLTQAGFALKRQIETGAEVSIFEAAVA